MRKKRVNNIFIIWILIIISTIFWRFINYQNRWILNQDQARDAIIALFSIKNIKLPMIGPPSSAGPMNFGPWYYWLIIIWTMVIPTIQGAWIGFTLMSIISVLLLAKIGELYAKKKGLLVIGLIASFAVGQVSNSADMLNNTITIFGASLALFSLAKYIKEKKYPWLYLLGFSIGLSINFHFQSLGLLSLFLVVLVTNSKSLIKKIKSSFIMLLGLATAFLPLFIFDIKRNGVWIKSVIEYYSNGINKFYVPVRWLTELKDFWPQLFGSVLVGIPNFGYILLAVTLFVFIKILKNKEKINKYWLILIASFLIQVVMVRFYKGVRTNSYFITFHAYIILITSWLILKLYGYKKIFGIIFTVIIILIATFSNQKQIQKNNSQSAKIIELKQKTETFLENKKINIFSFKDSSMISFPMFYLFYYENNIDKNGKKIGFCDGNKNQCPSKYIIKDNNYFIYKLDETNENLFNIVNDRDIYNILFINYQ